MLATEDILKNGECKLAITGEVFPHFYQQICAMPINDRKSLLERLRILASMTATNKADYIKWYKSVMQSPVMMVGDGANDQMAICMADVGVGVSTKDGQLFSTWSPDQSPGKALIVIKQSKASMAAYHRVIRFLNFYVMAQLVGLTVVFFENVSFTNSQFYFQDVGLGFLFYLTLSW